MRPPLKGCVWRGETIREAVKAIRCFGCAYVYWNGKEFVVSEEEGKHGEWLGVFSARCEEWFLAKLIREAMG
jgi:hypothetical protein